MKRKFKVGDIVMVKRKGSFFGMDPTAFTARWEVIADDFTSPTIVRIKRLDFPPHEDRTCVYLSHTIIEIKHLRFYPNPLQRLKERYANTKMS